MVRGSAIVPFSSPSPVDVLTIGLHLLPPRADALKGHNVYLMNCHKSVTKLVREAGGAVSLSVSCLVELVTVAMQRANAFTAACSRRRSRV